MKALDKINWQGELIPAIIQDYETGKVLMLGYMNEKALQMTLDSEFVTFFSRSRQAYWQKGETSGNKLRWKDIGIDCDGDTLLILAEPLGPTCHLNTETCFSNEYLQPLIALENTITSRKQELSEDSYTAELFSQGIARIAQKVGEEAVEVVIAAMKQDRQELCDESADLIYHFLVLLQISGLSLADINRRLRERGAV